MPTKTTRSVVQVVQSAYGWANGNVPVGTFLKKADLSYGDFGDSLEDFLTRETSPDSWSAVSPKENSPEHWEEAISRMEQVKREVATVLLALQQHQPKGESNA